MSDPRAWLPPDQTPTTKWPIVGERAPRPEALDLTTFRLEVTGLVAEPLSLSWAEVQAFPTQTLEMDVHCVTRWSHRQMRFDGFPLASLLATARPLPTATYARFVSASARDHDTGLSFEVALRDTWLVHGRDGQPLTVEHGFPLRTVTVGRYFYKSLKWVRRIELLDAPRLGWWEREDGYHENADPWPGDERFVTGAVRPDVAARFRAATDLGPYRGRTLRGLDLRGWVPGSRDLRGLQLKDCDLRGAVLDGCDLRGANFTLSNLRGASLRDVQGEGVDLEGAWLAGADLRGADLRVASLNGTSFVQPDDPEAPAPRVDGADFAGAVGLLEPQRAWLETQPVRSLP
ncbi:MAG: molybdopterin-dependent oxidoreductase [Bradymonadia bacterium]